MKRLLLMAIVAAFSACLYAQNGPSFSVSGTVFDKETKETIPGARIVLSKNKKAVANTDYDGRFRLDSVKTGTIIEISFVGYKTKVVKISEKDRSRKLDIYLDQDNAILQDVVVVSYGTTMPMGCYPRPSYNDMDRETYSTFEPNKFISTSREPLSTFSLDVDQESYTNVRRMILSGRKVVPKDAVRTEEFVNYFTYDHPAPGKDDDIIRITSHMTECPWNEGNRLLMIGLKAKEVAREGLPASNFVFLIDNSGSMSQENRLPLAISSLKMLIKQLRDDDCISVVTYGGGSKILVNGATGKHKEQILQTLDQIKASGYTAGQQGLETAYSLAGKHFIKGGNNRVIMVSDGDFNVGASSPKEIEDFIAGKRKDNIFITVLGFGIGNYRSDMMQRLAEKGNGTHAYIDSAKEAERLMNGLFAGTAFTLAKDVKIQVEFNPAVVGAYRLIGYESRMLDKDDFNDDTVDAGELGMGQTMTAVYEIIPAGAKSPYLRGTDPLRYGKKIKNKDVPANMAEAAFVKIRYKSPEGNTSRKIETPIANTVTPFEKAHVDMRFAVAVVEFAQLLSDNAYKGKSSFGHVISTAQKAKGNDLLGERAEFINIVKTAAAVLPE